LSFLLPELKEFGLIGMGQADRIDDRCWFSLPVVVAYRFPKIKLRPEFANTTAPVATDPLVPFVVDGYFDFKQWGIWAGKSEDAEICGIGNPEIVTLCRLAIACLQGDYRAFNCKRFLAALRDVAAEESPALLLAYLPCLSLMTTVNINSDDRKDVIKTVRDSTYFSTDTLVSVATELDKMAGLAALLIQSNKELFIPFPDIKWHLGTTQIKAWVKSLVTFSEAFNPQFRVRRPFVGSKNKGTTALQVAAASLNIVSAIETAFKPTEDKEPGPDEVEVLPDQAEEPSKHIKQYLVVDPIAMKADAALNRLVKDNWVPAKLTKLMSKMPGVELLPSKFEHLAEMNPHAAEPLLAIARSLRLHIRYGQCPLTFKPLLLVGEPGTGKSYVARQIASVCGLPSLFLSMAGMSDSHGILGVTRGWSTAGPSVARILGDGVVNPVIIFDEIEKAGTSSHNGNAIAALLPLLEHSTARVWYDLFFQAHIDCSRINFIATANNLTGMSAPLLSRFQIYHIRPMENKYYPKIIASVVKELAAELNVHPGLLPALNGEDIEFLINNCRDIRTLSLTVRRILEHRAAEAHSGVLH